MGDEEQQQPIEAPLKETDFQTAVDKLKQLSEGNEYVIGVIKVLGDEMRVGEQPAQGNLRERQSQGISEDEIATVLNWVALRSNFDNLDEAHNFLEQQFSRTVDKWNQPPADTQYQGHQGQYSSRYREARDQLLDAIKPYAKEHMIDATTKQLQYWTEAGILQNPTELIQKYEYGRVDAGHLQLYAWEGASLDTVHQIINVSMRLQSLLKSADLPVGSLKPMHIVLVPNGDYMRGGPNGTLGAADGRKGDRMIIRADIVDIDGVVGHEATHAGAAQLIGASNSIMMQEAFALGIGQIISPRGSVNNMMYHSGFQESVRRYQAGKDLGLTHDELLENEDINLPPQDRYPYAYRQGQMFFDFFNENPQYGLKKFIEVYQVTCRDTLFSSSTEDPDNPGQGKPLIKNSISAENVSEKELVEQAIKKVFREQAPQVLQELEAYYKLRTRQQIELTRSTPSQ